MTPKTIQRYAIVLAAWLPFFAIWVLFAMSYAHYKLPAAIAASMISMGSASALGIAVWHVCRRLPWPLRLSLKFYLLQIVFALAYSIALTIAVYGLDSIRRGNLSLHDFWRSPVLGWQLLTGLWLYGLFAGVSYAVQTRNRMHEKETLAARAEALAASARLDAIRARLNPHFLFNALHTLAALVKFHPAISEVAIERLGDMLRYTLKEDGRELVEFSEELDFTRQYIVFEQLRYEDRLKVSLQIDPESVHFDVPPFSLQTLAENAVRHAISVRPEGGSIWIISSCRDGKLNVTVRDDGPGAGADVDAGVDPRLDVAAGSSHQFGLRSLRERLRGAFGSAAGLCVKSGPGGFEASFEVPLGADSSVPRRDTAAAGFRSAKSVTGESL
ncbi:MAG: sensor histidine kinase [Candidatus Acidiferrales bacterium]